MRRVPHTSYKVACQISKKDLKWSLRILNFSVVLKLPFKEIRCRLGHCGAQYQSGGVCAAEVNTLSELDPLRNLQCKNKLNLLHLDIHLIQLILGFYLFICDHEQKSTHFIVP